METYFHLASRTSRLLAVLIDGFITFIFVLLIGFLTGISRSIFVEQPFSFSFFLISIMSIIIFNVIIPTFLWNGQTIGKRWIKIAVVKDTNEEVDLKTMLLRSIFLFLGQITLPIITNIISIIAFIDPLFIFSENKRTIHDMIAKTKVIDV